jgi:hypothetical protein
MSLIGPREYTSLYFELVLTMAQFMGSHCSCRQCLIVFAIGAPTNSVTIIQNHHPQASSFTFTDSLEFPLTDVNCSFGYSTAISQLLTVPPYVFASASLDLCLGLSTEARPIL